MAGANTIGLGFGVIILIVLWTITAFLWVLLSRSQTALRTAVTCLAVILTLLMFLIPTSKDRDSGRQGQISQPPLKQTQELYDYIFLGRAGLIVILFISIAAGLAIHASQFWSVKVQASNPVPKRRANLQQQMPFLLDFK